MKFFFSTPFEGKQKIEQDEHPIVIVDQSPHDITEGSEFLDDAIRMTDQPLMYTEESIAPGSPKGLW